MCTAERYTHTGRVPSPSLALQRECVHILSAGPLPFSKIAKKMTSETRGTKLSIEDTVKSVADFKLGCGFTNAQCRLFVRKTSKTAPGVFELKETRQGEFSPFFWHYTKQQMSEV